MIEARDVAIAAAEAASDKQGIDILILDVGALIGILDFFVFASGQTEPQVKAIIEAVEQKLGKLGEKPLRREGLDDSKWVILDYGSVVVHIFNQLERAYYEVERLWKDAPVIPWEDETTAARG